MMSNRPDSLRNRHLLRTQSTWSYDEELRHYRPESTNSNVSAQSTESERWVPKDLEPEIEVLYEVSHKHRVGYRRRQKKKAKKLSLLKMAHISILSNI